MEPKNGPGRAMGEGYKLLGLGMTFAGGIIVFMLAGLVLDRWLGVVPLFTVVGTLVGATLSFINVYVKLTHKPGDGGSDDTPRDRR